MHKFPFHVINIIFLDKIGNHTYYVTWEVLEVLEYCFYYLLLKLHGNNHQQHNLLLMYKLILFNKINKSKCKNIIKFIKLSKFTNAYYIYYKILFII